MEPAKGHIRSQTRTSSASIMAQGVYIAPKGCFIIKSSGLYEPIDETLWVECARKSNSSPFTLDHIYKTLKDSERCEHIWNECASTFGVTKSTDIPELCRLKFGFHEFPDDMVVIRKCAKPTIGGSFYRHVCRVIHTECAFRFRLYTNTEDLMLSEIYGGYWGSSSAAEDNDNVLEGLRSLMEIWLQQSGFRATDEGMLTRLVLHLGKHVDSQRIANLAKTRMVKAEYILTKLRCTGMGKSGMMLWSARFEAEEGNGIWQRVEATLKELTDPESGLFSISVSPS